MAMGPSTRTSRSLHSHRVFITALVLAAPLLCLHADTGSDSQVVVTRLGAMLMQGRTLRTGESMKYVYTKSSAFIMQNDCNLVVQIDGSVKWESGTENAATSCYLTMQADGNLVIYHGNGSPVWASQTVGRGQEPYFLVYQPDNNAVIYSSGPDGFPGEAIWATNTAGQQ